MAFLYFYSLIAYLFLILSVSFLSFSYQNKIFFLKKKLKNDKIVKIWLLFGFFIVIFRKELAKFLYNQTEKSLNNLDLFFFLKIDNFLHDFLTNYFLDLNIINKKDLKKLLKDDFLL